MVVSDGTNYARDSVYATVYPTLTLTISGLNPTYSVADAPVTLTGYPQLGEFSGLGISGNIFDPAAAGVGTHTITYTYYEILTNTSTGRLTLFFDDFSTDKGWTGYGAQCQEDLPQQAQIVSEARTHQKTIHPQPIISLLATELEVVTITI